MSFLSANTALIASYQAGAARAREADANAGAAHARARANVLARSADELRQDLILAQIEVQDLESQVSEAKDELEAERGRTLALMSMIIKMKQPGLSADQFALTLQTALRAIRAS